MSLRGFVLCLAAFAASFGVASAATDPVALVDPFVGTSGTKIGGPIDTFPGADAPFGMLQFSPDTPGQPAGGGYDYKDTAITGFSLDHLSGPGCSVFGDFGILPTVGETSDPAQAKQSFSHKDETASPGYYAVTLGSARIQTELTAGLRDGIARFTFPASQSANVLINAASNQGGVNDTNIQIVSPTQIEGSATSGQFCGMPDVYTVYFAAQFDRPTIASGLWGGGRGTQAGAWARFDTSSDRAVTMHVALSWVSQAGAWTNLRAGIASFDDQRSQTQTLWRNLLGRVSVTGGTDAQERTFYTALYHVLLHPNVYSDADGLYRGFDNTVHRVRSGHIEYATFSGWDIYRTQVPLMAMIAPGATSDMMQSLVDAAHQGGWLPKWPLVNGYSGVMGGDPAAPIFAGAYAFGARNFDVHAALAAMIKNASDETSPAGQGWYRPRPGLDEYERLGYVVNTHTTNVSPVPNGASLTLEYALDDFSIAQFAKTIGNMNAYRTYMGRSQTWRNLFNTQTGLISPRDKSGAFMNTPITSNGQSGFQEGNAAQYTWMVPQDLAGLIYGMGGREAATAKLDAFFSQLNAGQDKPYAWLGNEPSLGVPWVYLSTGAPSKAQRIIRDALDTLYGDTPDGIPGNDDLGTMSAWYVWCALGLYPQDPAVPSFDLGAPLFTSARIAVPGGAQITIDAPAAGVQAPYVQALLVNGRAHRTTWLQLPRNGSLALTYDLVDQPTAWGDEAADAPPSFPATVAKFPAATTAEFTTGDHLVSIAPGEEAAVHLSLADSNTAHPATVTWRVNLPRGLSAFQGSGSSPANGTISILLRANALAAAHYYPISVTAKADNGAILEPWPLAAKVAAANTQIPLGYVANYSDDTVDAFDPQTGAIAATIAVGNNPGDVVRSTDGSRVYVANQGSNTISVIDAADMRVIATIKTGKVPATFRIAPDGTSAWVTDFGDNAVQRIDLRTLRAGRLVPVGRAPQELAFAPDGTMLYVTAQNDNDVMPIDLRSGQTLAPIPVGAHPFGIVISKDGTTAYVTNSGDGTVTPIDLRTRTLEPPIRVGVQPQGMALDATGKRLYVADSGADTISVIDTARRARIDTIRVGLNPADVAISADGRDLFAVAMGDNACVKILIARPTDPSPIQMGNVPIALALP